MPDSQTPVRKTLEALEEKAASGIKTTMNAAASQLGFESFLKAGGITVLPEPRFNSLKQRHAESDAESITLVNRELAMYAQDENSLINPEAIQKAKQHREMFQEVQGWGTGSSTVLKHEEEQKERLKEENARREAKEAKMMEPIHVPKGRQTGMPRVSPPRMLRLELKPGRGRDT